MSDIVQPLLLQLILILINAFFAATEIALISLNEKKVKARAEDGDKKSIKMLKIIEEPTGFLSTIQVGITLAGFLGSAFAADNFADDLANFAIKKIPSLSGYESLVNTVSVIIITLILSYFTLVLGELVPKRIAMRHKEKLATAVCGIISFLAVVLKPIVWLLTVSTNACLRIFGIDPYEKDESVSQDDIELMLDVGADEGTLDQDDIEYIKNVFKLNDLTAADVMTPRKAIVNISSEASIEEVLHTIETEGYSRIPVYSDSKDEIEGILYVKDFLLKYDKPGFKLEDAMFAPSYVPETIHLDMLLKEMQDNHNHIVVVVNEYGVSSGIVTIEDILEEIVGEIWDEGDEEFDNIKKIDEGVYQVTCTTSIEEFFTFFQLEAPEDSESTTVNGWITENCGNIPQVGYSFEYENIEITVTQADDIMAHMITVIVKEIPDIDEDEQKKD